MFINVKTSLRRKLMLVVLATTVVALLTTAVALSIYDLRTYQRQWVSDLMTQADILGQSSAAALAFDDPRVARENLALLRYRPNIAAAAIYKLHGGLYATYVHDDSQSTAFPQTLEFDGYRTEGKYLTLARPIRDNDGIIGGVYIRAHYGIVERMVDYGGILGVVMAFSLLVAAFMSSRLEAAVTRPILAITEVARRVMTERDFSLRVRKTTDDEIGYLVDAFNNMLGEVGQRASDLEASNRRLEAEMGERRMAEEALREADRRKDEFLATLAHELRNPLAPMRNALELLRMGHENPALSQRATDIIERQLAQMVHLVNDLLDVSRISTGKISLHAERAELGAILRESVVSAEPMLDARNHRFTLELCAEPVALVCDPVRLTQVFSNLINNAAKYTPPGGDIRATLHTVENAAVVTVSDNGQGIPRSMLAAIFDMFTQVDHTLERAQSGLGVGLSLAKRLVELHGGTIEGQSDGPGCGSRFIVRLPLSGSALRANGARSAVAAPMSVAALRVLIADDNQDFAESLAVLLEAGGHAVRVTHDGNAAVAQAFALPPDVAFLDIGLPGRNGYDVAHTLRSAEATRGAMLVAITGWGQEKDRTLAREAGFDRHLVKPVAPEAITAILADVAARRSPEIVHDTQI
jgi:signal transduction histidine kinase/ActR/RegA family two-component response regulator